MIYYNILLYYYYAVNSVRANSELFIVNSSYNRVSALCFYASFIRAQVYYILRIIVDLITYYIRVVNRLFYTRIVFIMYSYNINIYVHIIYEL
jgi:hypothetical protein